MPAVKAFATSCFVLLIAGPSAAAPGSAAPQAVPMAETLSGEHKRDFELYRQILSGQAYPLDLRRTAAIRLLERGWPQGISEMADMLADTEKPRGQLAVAEALAEALPKLDPRPPRFINPLISALSAKDEKLREAAGSALANYNHAVLPALGEIILRTDPQTSDATRLAAVAAVERIKDKKSAEILIDALDDQNSQLAARCRQGLEHLTGIGFGDDYSAWRRWWQQYKDKELTEWLELYLVALDSQNRDLQKRVEALRSRLQGQIEARWQTAQDKTKLLSELLSDPLEDVRLQGLYLARNLPAGEFPAQLSGRIRQMVSDSSAPVRSVAAELLRDLRDKQAGKVILEQLRQEPDPKVRASLANALGYVGGAEVVQPLVEHLADPSPIVVGEAAVSLGKLASAEGVQPLRASIVQALLDRYAETSRSNGGDAGLRSKLLSAMVQIGSPSFRPLFMRALVDDSALSRAVAVEGLRRLPADSHRKETLAAVRPLLSDSDRGVRLEVLRAIDTLADSGEVTSLEQRLDPNVEPDPDVRQEVWRVLVNLLKDADLDTLDAWERRAAAAGVDRHEQILRILEARLIETRGGPLRLIEVREKLGDCLAGLKRWQAAADKYSLAYEQSKTIAHPEVVQVRPRLALKLLGALLDQGNFEQAGRHLASIASAPSSLEEKSLEMTLTHLESLLSDGEPGKDKDIEAAFELISTLERLNLPGLSRAPLAGRLARLKTEALEARNKADKELVIMNINRLVAAAGGSQEFSGVRLVIGKLGPARAGRHLLDELARLLALPGRNLPREKVVAELLAGLDPTFAGYDLAAPLDQRRSMVTGWQGFLRDKEFDSANN